MASVTVFSQTGHEVESLELRPDVFEVQGSQQVVHQVVVGQLARQRQGTASVKTRSMVSGGGKKPWKQKGTGRARAGTSRSPVWRGGGVVHGPVPHKYAFRLPRKMRQAALRACLSDKLRAERLKVIDNLAVAQARTREMVTVVDDLQLDGCVLFLVDALDPQVEQAARNIPYVFVSAVASLSAWNLVCVDWVVITKAALDSLQSTLAKGSE